jgi:hypothetical protein
MFFGTDIVGLSTGGSERMRIDSSGNVGIGTTAPRTQAMILGAGQTTAAITDSGNQGGTLTLAQNTAAGASGGALLFAALNNNGTYVPQVALKGLLEDGTANGIGSLAFSTRATTGATSLTERMRITSAGRVGINTSSPSTNARLTVNGNIAVAIPTRNAASSNQIGVWTSDDPADNSRSRITFATTAGASSSNSHIAFSTNNYGVSGGERMRIDPDGNLLLGTTSAQAFVTLHTTSETISIRNTAAAAGRRRRVTVDGNNTFYVINEDTVGVSLGHNDSSWGAVSDERHKDIIEPITDAANKVSSLRAVIGKYKTDQEEMRRSFLIAQDVQAVLPEAVNATDPEKLGLRYTEVMPLLVAAIQEQQAIINDLKARLDAANL